MRSIDNEEPTPEQLTAIADSLCSKCKCPAVEDGIIFVQTDRRVMWWHENTKDCPHLKEDYNIKPRVRLKPTEPLYVPSYAILLKKHRLDLERYGPQSLDFWEKELFVTGHTIRRFIDKGFLIKI
jgi:hypothetical protein